MAPDLNRIKFKSFTHQPEKKLSCFFSPGVNNHVNIAFNYNSVSFTILTIPLIYLTVNFLLKPRMRFQRPEGASLYGYGPV